MAMFYDTHAHLDYPEFSAIMPEVMVRAAAAGIPRIITIGTDLESSRRAIRLAEQFPGVFAAVGWHPNDAPAAPDDLRPALRELAAHPKVVAIGETGLDYHRLPSRQPGGTPEDDQRLKRKQAQIFEQQLEVAAQLGLNCIIHQRDSLDDTLARIRPWAGKLRAVFHCFANDPAVLRQLLELDFLVSFTGILTFKNAANVREALAAAPLGKFMLETDCPYLAPEPFRSVWPSEPMHVKITAERAAQVKGCTLEQLSGATCAAAHAFFPKLSRPA